MGTDRSRLYASALIVLAGGLTLGLGEIAGAGGRSALSPIVGSITWLVGSILFLMEYRRPNRPPE